MEPDPYIDLVARAREGDLAAFGELVERFQDAAVGYAWGQLGDLPDARDVAQDAFVDVLRKIAMLRDPAAFPTWLRTIVATHCRRRRRWRDMTTPVEPPVPARPVEDDVVDREQAERVRRLVGTLPPHERVVIAMHHLGGCTFDEIAMLLGISRSAAKKRAHSARARLHDRWESSTMDIHEAIDQGRPSRDRRFASSTLLFAAIAREDVALARELLTTDPTLVDVEERYDDETARAAGLLPARDASPLVRAVGRGSRELVELLLRHGADVNRRCACDGGESPLWAATVQGDHQLVELLLDRGADPNAAAFAGVTPLHVAAMRGYETIAQRLIAAGANPDALDSRGRSPGGWPAATARRRADGASPVPTHELDRAGPPPLLESGIKAINLFAPLRRGSAVRWIGPAGTGSLVLLTELMHHLATFENLAVDVIGFEHAGLTGGEVRHAAAELDPAARIHVQLAAEDQPSVERRRRFADAAAAASLTTGVHRPRMVVVATHPAHLADIEAQLPRLLETAELVVLFDLRGSTTDGLMLPADITVIALDETLARAQLFPAIDPERTTGPIPDGQHAAAADAARALLVRYRELDPDLSLTPRPDEQPWTTTAQALHRTLTQPFHTTEPFTGQPGAAVSIDETLSITRAVLDGANPDGLDEHTLPPR